MTPAYSSMATVMGLDMPITMRRNSQHSYLRDFRLVFFDCFFFDRFFEVFFGDFLAVFETAFFPFFTRFFAAFFARFCGVLVAWAFAAFFTGAGVRLATAFLARFATALTAVSASVPAA
jgi:hypothetical protein